MKTNNTLTKLIMLAVLMAASMSFTTTAFADDLWKCKVTSDGDTEVRSLETYLTLFNMPEGDGFCRDAIEFVPALVNVQKPIELKVNDTSADFNLGNDEGNLTVLNVAALDDETPIITIGTETESLQDITIQRLHIKTDETGGHGPFIKCENNSANININNVTIENAPVKPWNIVGCTNVKINGVKVVSMGDAAEGFITATRADGFELTNTSTDYTFKGMTGPVLSINDTENYNIGGLTISYDDAGVAFSADDAVISIDDSYGTVGSIAITNSPMTGIAFSNMAQSYGANTTFTSSLQVYGDSVNSFAGFTLDAVDSLSLQALAVSGFDTGVRINDTKNSTFSGSSVEIFGNTSYGIELAGTSSQNTINGTQTTNQEHGCGIYFNSTGLNRAYSNNLFNNDLCGVTASVSGAVATLGADDIVVLRQGESSIRVDLNVAEANGTPIMMIELHQVQSDVSDYTGEVQTVSRNSNSRFAGIAAMNPANLKTTNVVAKFNRVNGKMVKVSNTSAAKTANTAYTSAVSMTTPSVLSTSADSDELDMENAQLMRISGGGGSATASNSLLGDGPILTTKMPFPIDGVNPNAAFFALAYDGVSSADAHVIAVWEGVAVTDASSYDEEGHEGCYWDETSQTWTRVNDLDPVTGDSDQDGILDWYEDYDRDCTYDVGSETDVSNSDSDGDGIADGVEDANRNGVVDDGETNAYSVVGYDTDGDGLSDGTEDSNFDGDWDGATDDDGDGKTGETSAINADSDSDGLTDAMELQYGTDPLDNDSDDDTLLDGNTDEKCPLVSGTENCYYNNCVKADNADVSAAVSSGDSSFDGEADGYCDDADGDSICSADEDANSNCQWDAGETNANNPDTDADGIADGGANGEDINYDGNLDTDLGESDPTSTDSDNDGIADGDEMSHTEWTEGSGKGDRTLVDTDSDGISDGDEDSSPSGTHNGIVDAGETDLSLSDTDGDGTGDATDICPWSTNANCVVRYYGVNGYSDYDADGDGLPDVDEDTDGDGQWTKANKEGSPLDADSDDDGLTDNYEDCFGTNPVSSDTDGDGRNDFEEVESSIDQCTTMFNLGDTNPLHAEFGGCSLNKNLATKDGVMPITIMVLAALAIVMIKRKQTQL